jgi:hypothetical protein
VPFDVAQGRRRVVTTRNVARTPLSKSDIFAGRGVAVVIRLVKFFDKKSVLREGLGVAVGRGSSPTKAVFPKRSQVALSHLSTRELVTQITR